MFGYKSVCEIFLTMDCEDSPMLNRKGKEWLDSYKISNNFGGHVSTKINAIIDISLWKEILNKIKSSLKDECDFLTEILNETLYNLRDAKEIASKLYNDFNYYFQTAKDRKIYANKDEVVDLDIDVRDIYILGRLLAPVLISGCTIRIHPLNDSLVPYLVAIGDFLVDCGVPKGGKYVFFTNVVEDPKRLTFNGFSSSHCCPMLLFEESDLDSALDCLIESSFRFNGMREFFFLSNSGLDVSHMINESDHLLPPRLIVELQFTILDNQIELLGETGGVHLYWSVTHAYIQESIFDVIVSKLLDHSQRSQRFEFINCGQHNNLNMTRNCTPTFFTGWDPRELELAYDLNMSVCLLPFRTTDEVVSLVSMLGCATAASIWTDKLSVANRVIKLLKIDNIWVNAHGLIAPSIPFESCFETKLPFNGYPLLEYLTRVKDLSSEFFLDSIILESDDWKKKNKHLFRNSVAEAVDFAIEGYKVLSKLDDLTIHSLFNLLLSEKFKINMVSKITSRLDSIYHPFSKVDVLCYKSSYEIVMITCMSTDVDIAFFLQLLLCLIATRNAVIVNAVPDVLHKISGILPPTLPKGIVTLINVNDMTGFSSQYKRIGKCLHFYFNTNTESSRIFGEDTRYLCSLFSKKKLVWLQNE